MQRQQQMTVSRLRSGDTFRVDLGSNAGYIDYRLIYVNDCRAYVEPLMRRKKTISVDHSDLTGLPVVEFESASGRVNISPGTECTVLEEDVDLVGPRDDDDDLTGPLVKSKKTKKVIGTRPLDPTTKRGQVVAMLAAGKTVMAVCDKLNIKRSCALSHMSDARKFNGVAYVTDGDRVKVTLS